MPQRSAQPALRSLGRLGASIRASRTVTRRTFSTTPRNEFSEICQETDNTKLNAIMKDIQEKIILPAYLPPKQRKIVFDLSKRGYLEQNPIDVEVGGLEYRFKTIDAAKDVPKARPSLWSAMETMETEEDWQNVGTIIAGFKKAGVRMQPKDYSKLLRLACSAGRIDMVVECLKQWRQTGMCLTTKEQYVRLNMALLELVKNHPEQSEHAVKLGRVVLDLIQQPESLELMKETYSTPAEYLHHSPVGRALLLYVRLIDAKAKKQIKRPIDKELVVIKDDIELLKTAWQPILKAEHIDANTETRDFQELHRKVSASQSQTSQGLSSTEYWKALDQVTQCIRLAQEFAPEEAKPLEPLLRYISRHIIKDKQEERARRQETKEEAKPEA